MRLGPVATRGSFCDRCNELTGSQADRRRGPDQGHLPRAGAQRAEVEHHEQGAEKHHADLGRDVGEGEHDRHADDQLRRDEIVILKALGESRFRKHQIDGDGGEPAGGEGRPDGGRYIARLGVDREDQGVDDVADRDHRLDLAALPGAARQHLRRRLGTYAFQFSRNRVQKRGRRGAHDLAVNGTQAEKSTWESL